MGVVPLLTREGEVAIAKRIERGQLKTQKAIARSPIAVREVLKIGEDLEAAKINIRDTVTFSEQAELTGDEDKAEEYRSWTIEGIQNIDKLCNVGLKEFEKLRARAKRVAREEEQETDAPSSQELRGYGSRLHRKSVVLISPNAPANG